VLIMGTTAHVQVALLEGITLGADGGSARHTDGHLRTGGVHTLHGDQLALLVSRAAHLLAVVPALAGGTTIRIHLVATFALKAAVRLWAGEAGVLLAFGCFG